MRNPLIRRAVILLALLFPAPSVLIFFNGNWYSFFHSYSLGMFFGLMSYGYFSLSLILAARIRILDRMFGHDKVIVFHGLIATFAAASAIAHAVLKRMYFPDYTNQIYLGIAGILLFLGVIILTVVFMVKTPLHRIPGLKSLLSQLNSRISPDYSLLKLIHNLTAPALLIIIFHVMAALPVQENTVRMTLMFATGILAVMIYIIHKFVRPLYNRIFSFKVKAVNTPAPGVIEIIIESGRRKLFNFRAGQFAYFRFHTMGLPKSEHPFTISSAPGNDELSITVKALGDYTKKMLMINPGDIVSADGPYGVFTPPYSQKPLLFLAGGIGITPFTSIVGHYNRNFPERNVKLVWAVLKPEDAFATEFFRESEKRNPSFTYTLLVNAGINPYTGITDPLINRTMMEQYISPEDRSAVQIYLCGPEPFKAALFRIFDEMNIPKNNIFLEKFSF
jgi:predicted ferric reductase